MGGLGCQLSELTGTSCIFFNKMLHNDMKEILDIKEIIDLAYSEFQPLVSLDADVKIKCSSDSGGKILDISVTKRSYAKILRKEIPHTYNGIRTVVIYNILE